MAYLIVCWMYSIIVMCLTFSYDVIPYGLQLSKGTLELIVCSDVCWLRTNGSDVCWLRTNGVSTNGAAVKSNDFDGLGKRYALALWGRWKQVNGSTRKVPEVVEEENGIRRDPVGADPIRPSPSTAAMAGPAAGAPPPESMPVASASNKRKEEETKHQALRHDADAYSL